MTEYRTYINKLKAIQEENHPLSLYDLQRGIFQQEIEEGKVQFYQIMKHKFKSEIRRDGKVIKVDKHEHAYDYIISQTISPFDTNRRELMVATIYVSNHSSIKDNHKETYRDNPLYDQRYGITRIELHCIEYNERNPENTYTVTKYKI